MSCPARMLPAQKPSLVSHAINLNAAGNGSAFAAGPVPAGIYSLLLLIFFYEASDSDETHEDFVSRRSSMVVCWGNYTVQS